MNISPAVLGGVDMARLFEKYTEENPPIQCFMPDSTWYKGSTSAFTPKGILWHDTGADNDTLRRYVQPADNDPNYQELIALIGKNKYGNDWEHIEKQAGLNCWVGRLADGKVTTLQAGPWTKRPWGCGSGSKGSLNDTHIQWEICQDAKTDKSYFADVYEESVQLSAYLCKMFNIDPHGTITYKGIKVPTIVCHWDSYNLKCGSGHGDIYDWTVMYDYLGIPKKSVNINDPYDNLIMQRIRDDIAAAMQPEPAHKDGWVKSGGKWYYYKDGKMLKSAWIIDKGDKYYLGADGAMLTGWQTINRLEYYFYSDGHMACDEWLGGYFINMDGNKDGTKGAWKSNSKGKWWQISDGRYPKNRSVRIDKKDYQFDKNGYLIT